MLGYCSINVVNIKVTKSIKQHSYGGYCYLLSTKKSKRSRKKIILQLELFQQVHFVNFYIYITCRLQKPKKTIARVLCLHMGVPIRG